MVQCQAKLVLINSCYHFTACSAIWPQPSQALSMYLILSLVDLDGLHGFTHVLEVKHMGKWFVGELGIWQD